MSAAANTATDSVSATAKFVRTPPRKARLVADLIRGKTVAEAHAILAYSTRAAALPVHKVLQSAAANADHNASVNLHRRFLLDDEAVKAFRDWQAKPKEQRYEAIERIEQSLRRDLLEMHGLEKPTPF